MREFGQQLGAGLAAHLDEVIDRIAAGSFGQCQVVVRRAGRTGAHRGAEAQSAGLGAVDRNDESTAASAGVAAVRVLTADQDPVEDSDGGQVTAADAEKGVAGIGPGVLLGAVATGRKQPLAWRVEELLPRLRAG